MSQKFTVIFLLSYMLGCFYLPSEYSYAYRSALCFDPNLADLHRGKTRQSVLDAAARRLGQDEAYLTVREILSEASTTADSVLWCERSGFGRFRFASLGSNRETWVFPSRAGLLAGIALHHIAL